MLTLGEVKYSIDTNGSEPVEKALRLLTDCFKHGGKLLVCGNGGSAADCEHIVAELMKGMNSGRLMYGMAPLQGALPAISLVSQVGLITAILNDIGGDWIFAQQVYGYGKNEDALLAISTSGKSTNVIRAMEFAQRLRMYVIGLTGPTPSEHFVRHCDALISCPGNTAAEIQEQHIKVYHELCTRLEEEFFP